MIRLFLFSILVLAAPGSIRADPDATPPTPKPPLVQPIGPMAHFIITFGTSPSSSPATPPAAKNPDDTKSVEVTKTGNIEKVVLTANSGASQTLWMLGQTIYTRDSEGRAVTQSFDSVGDPGYLQPNQTAYYGTKWINLQSYQGVQSSNGASCYCYSTASPNPGPDNSPTPSPSPAPAEPLFQAWISVETNLPVAVQTPEGFATYQILPAPSDMLQPPEDFVAYNRRAREMYLERLRQAESR